MKRVWKFVDAYRYLLLCTGIIVMLGLIFSRALQMGDVEEEAPVLLNVPIASEGQFYFLSLGTFQNSEEVLAVEGALRVQGIPMGMTISDEGYHLFTQVVPASALAEEVMGVLATEGIEFELEVQDVLDSPAWGYFYEAVNQRPFEMADDFLDVFADDKMAIWGYFILFSRGGGDLLPSARQQMLLETFEWLIMESGDIIGTSEDEGYTPE